MNSKKIFWIVLGSISLGVGAIGAFIPLLPSFPFLLLAVYSYSKSSERLHSWFINTKIYKNNLESHLSGKGMTKAAKIRVMCTVTCIYVIRIYYDDSQGIVYSMCNSWGCMVRSYDLLHLGCQNSSR